MRALVAGVALFAALILPACGSSKATTSEEPAGVEGTLTAAGYEVKSIGTDGSGLKGEPISALQLRPAEGHGNSFVYAFGSESEAQTAYDSLKGIPKGIAGVNVVFGDNAEEIAASIGG